MMWGDMWGDMLFAYFFLNFTFTQSKITLIKFVVVKKVKQIPHFFYSICFQNSQKYLCYSHSSIIQIL
jgi:hypothetical protein